MAERTELDDISSDALAFAIFCIENLSARLNMAPEGLYPLLTEQSDILYNYIIPCYDSLHTQDKEYILDDILGVMRRRGVLN